MSTQTRFDLAGLQQAIENLDAGYQVALYASNAEVEIIDQGRRVEAPRTLRGKKAIAEWIRTVTSQGTMAQVVAAEAKPNQVALSVDYQNQDRSRLRYEWTAEVSRGQISRGIIRVSGTSEA